MPDDASGNFSLTSSYLAVTGQTIQPSQHNPPLEDIATALTNRLSRSGVAPMTGPLKTITGSAANPAIYPNSNATIGIYWTATGIAFSGTVAGVRYIGELIPYTLLTPEPLTVLPYGQTLLRASYPDLWAKAQTDIAAGNKFYNNGNGSTTFGIGDMRGRVIAGKDNMGGTVAGRLGAVAGFNADASVLGSTGGSETHLLTAAQMPSHNHGGETSTTGAHTHNYQDNQAAGSGFVVASGTGYLRVDVPRPTTLDGDHWHTIPWSGGDTAHNNTQPTMVCNYLLFVGA